jgi:cobyrinic acid a,c-diamide synthase
LRLGGAKRTASIIASIHLVEQTTASRTAVSDVMYTATLIVIDRHTWLQSAAAAAAAAGAVDAATSVMSVIGNRTHTRHGLLVAVSSDPSLWR